VPGRRHVMDSAGSTYEDFVSFLLGRISSLVRVPREKDFGIDFYCQPRVSAGPRTETVAELGSIQVKGGDAELTYGGMNQRGEWREYEFAWLRSLVTPLYLARVNANCSEVDLYSIWPLWLIFWRQSANPFRVVFVTQPAERDSHPWQDPQSSPHPEGAGKGDGAVWSVDLGPPFLRLTNEKLNDAEFGLQAVAILRTRILYDRLTLMRFHQFIPWLTGITNWKTDCIDSIEMRTWQFWGTQPGENISRLCLTAAPILVSLGTHLQWQNDKAAYELIPVLEWLELKGHLDPMGKGLLDGLRETKAKDIGPGDEIAGISKDG